MWYQNTDEMTSTNDSTLILILKHINYLIWPTGILQKQRHCALNIFKNQKMWQPSVQKLEMVEMDGSVFVKLKRTNKNLWKQE